MSRSVKIIINVLSFRMKAIEHNKVGKLFEAHRNVVLVLLHRKWKALKSFKYVASKTFYLCFYHPGEEV